MSVKAYLVKEDVKIIDGKKYVHEEHEYLWNNWRESEVWRLLSPIINDYTDDDCVGFIELLYDDWQNLKENIKNDKNFIKHKDVFQKINNSFDNNDYIRIKLY